MPKTGKKWTTTREQWIRSCTPRDLANLRRRIIGHCFNIGFGHWAEDVAQEVVLIWLEPAKSPHLIEWTVLQALRRILGEVRVQGSKTRKIRAERGEPLEKAQTVLTRDPPVPMDMVLDLAHELAQLQPAQASAFVGLELEGMTPKQFAEREGRTIGNARISLCKAKALLRERFQRLG